MKKKDENIKILRQTIKIDTYKIECDFELPEYQGDKVLIKIAGSQVIPKNRVQQFLSEFQKFCSQLIYHR
jgi:hypothetical protein